MISSGGAAPRARRLWAAVAALGLLACAGVEPSISEREIEQKLEQGQGALARGQPGEARALFGQALAAGGVVTGFTRDGSYQVAVPG